MRALRRRDSRLEAGLLATTAALAVTALWVRWSAKKAEKQYPPAGRFVEVDGVRLHYLEQGSGPVVLLLHGNGAQAQDFVGCGLMEALASRYRVIAFDRPGFGYSERPRDRIWTPRAQAQLISKACTSLGVDHPIVLGHSFGTLVSLALAIENPLWIRGLVLVSGYYFPTMRLDTWINSPPALPLLGDILRYTVSPLLGKLMMPGILKHAFYPNEVAANFRTAVPAPIMLRPWQLKATAEDSGLMVPCAASLSRHYAEISQPVEIIAGSGDKLVKPDKQSVRLHKRLPQSSLHLFPGVGHMLHYGMTNELVGAVDRVAR